MSPESFSKLDQKTLKQKKIVVCPTYDYPPKSETSCLDQPHLWYQLYLTIDRNTTINLINLAKNSGYQALVITVDAPILGKRERDQRQTFSLPPEYGLKNLERFSNNMSVKGDKESGSGLLKLFADQVDKTFTWKDLEWIKENCLGLPIVLKGIQSEEDALLCGSHLHRFLTCSRARNLAYLDFEPRRQTAARREIHCRDLA